MCFFFLHVTTKRKEGKEDPFPTSYNPFANEDADDDMVDDGVNYWQQGGADDNTDAFNAQMVSIAELINHPMPNRTMEDVEAPTAEQGTSGQESPEQKGETET